MTQDPCLWGWAVLGLSLVHGSYDCICRTWAYGRRALSEDFVSCFHVKGSCLCMMSWIEHGYALVDCLLKDVVGIVGYFLVSGIKTVSITWMIPLEVLMLALITFALLIVKLLPLALMAISAPLTVLRSQAWQLVLLSLSGHNMIGQDSGKLLFILGFRRDSRYTWTILQRLICGCKNRKRPSPLSVSTRPAALTAADKSFKTAGINCSIDNVFFGSTHQQGCHRYEWDYGCDYFFPCVLI